MGADLYIRSICEKNAESAQAAFDEARARRDALPRDSKDWEAAQEKVSEAYEAMYPENAYFRDSYNETSVLWTLGLSWWQDVIPLLDDGGVLKGDNLQRFKQMVIDAPQTIPAGENSVEEWHSYFQKKRQKLAPRYSEWVVRAESAAVEPADRYRIRGWRAPPDDSG